MKFSIRNKDEVVNKSFIRYNTLMKVYKSESDLDRYFAERDLRIHNQNLKIQDSFVSEKNALIRSIF